MKKRIAFTILAAIVGLFTFIGCSEDKPYSMYQIGIEFQGISHIKESTDIETPTPPADKDKLAVANFIAGWMINNRFVMAANLGNSLIFEGNEDLTDQQNTDINDKRAKDVYDMQVIKLDEKLVTKSLDQIIIDAQNETGEDKLTLTTSGSVDFRYYMTGLQPVNGQPQVCQKSYTVNYAPI